MAGHASLCDPVILSYAACSLGTIPKLRGIVAASASGLVFWWQLWATPFLRPAVNFAWDGMWLSIFYTSTQLAASIFSSYEHAKYYTNVRLREAWRGLNTLGGGFR